MNTSCPNEGHNRCCATIRIWSVGITEAVKNEIADRPLVIKLGVHPAGGQRNRGRRTPGRGTTPMRA